MKILLRLVILCLTSALVAATTVAQDEDKVEPFTPSGVRPGKRVPRSLVSSSVRLEGVDVEHAEGLVQAVLGIQRERYECPTCASVDQVAGSCEACEVPMEPAGVTDAIARARLEGDRMHLVVTVQPHHWVGLDELAALVERSGGRLLREDFQLPAYARFAVEGGTASDAARLRGALVDMKLFPSASVGFDEATGLLWARPRSGEEHVSLTRVRELLGRMRGELTLGDVQWSAYCSACAREPAAPGPAPACSQPLEVRDSPARRAGDDD